MRYNLLRDIKTGRKFYAEYSEIAGEWYEMGTGEAHQSCDVEFVRPEPEDKDAPDDARKYTDLRLSPILRLLGMIGKWTKAADFYAGKLADSLEKHGFAADAKCVREHLRARRGEPVARATQDATEAVTIEGWVARDKSGELCFYLKEPSRGMFVWISESEFSCLPRTLFPYLCWEDEPKKVSVTIKAE
jgi:hypothetical protein